MTYISQYGYMLHLCSAKFLELLWIFSTISTAEVGRNTIYLADCILCPKPQYVGKCEPEANKRIKTHRHDVTSPNGGPYDKHFLLPGHNFNDHARFTLIEQVNALRGMSKAEIRKLLEDREDYWMVRLKTLQPNGFNDHLNSSLRQNIHGICN